MESPRATEKIPLKIVLLGEGCVGKTSLIVRYTQNSFQDSHVATIQASFSQKRIHLQNQRLELNIWDTAGQERYHALSPIYYRDAQGALIVFDVTDQDSFLRCKRWVSELRSILGPHLPIALVANKIDLDKDRVITPEEIEEYAKSIRGTSSAEDPLAGSELDVDFIQTVETSAKTGRGVDLAFLNLAKVMLRQRVSKEKSNSRTSLPNIADSVRNADRLARSPSSSSANRRSLVVLNENRLRESHVNLGASTPSTTGGKSTCCVIS